MIKEEYLFRKRELESKIKSNENWLSENWHLGKQIRRDCQYNIDRDKKELELINEALNDWGGVFERRD